MAPRSGQLHGGRHGLPRSFVVSNQRERLLAAVADTVAEGGYAGLTVAEVVRRAGVSRRTFYDQFTDKREVFLAAYDATIEQCMGATASAFASCTEWPEQGRRALRAFLGFLANDPAFTRLGIVEIQLVGTEGLDRYLTGRVGFEVFLAPGAALAGRPIPLAVPKVVGSGIFALIHSRVVRGRTAELPALLPACVHLCIAPYLGLEAATREARLAQDELA